jgi:hypothetical protein
MAPRRERASLIFQTGYLVAGLTISVTTKGAADCAENLVRISSPVGPAVHVRWATDRAEQSHCYNSPHGGAQIELGMMWTRREGASSTAAPEPLAS